MAPDPSFFALEAVQFFHARRGASEQAATILGFVERLPTPFAAFVGSYRDEVARSLVREADTARWKELGAPKANTRSSLWLSKPLAPIADLGTR